MTEDQLFDILEYVEKGGKLTKEKLQEVNDKLDSQLCCSGYECGCYGATYRDQYEHYLEKENPEGFKKYVERGRTIQEKSDVQDAMQGL